MKKIVSVIAILCFVNLMSVVLAKIPYKLKDGEMIDAMRLNENFEYVDSIGDADGKFEIKASGILIGRISRDSWLYFNPVFIPARLNRNGTIAIGGLNTNDADGDYVYFKQTGCQGEAYAYRGLADDENFRLPEERGRIFDHQESLYYYAADEVNIYNISVLSVSWGSECSTTSRQGLFFKLSPNNSQITGIQTYPFPLPLIIIGASEINIITE